MKRLCTLLPPLSTTLLASAVLTLAFTPACSDDSGGGGEAPAEGEGEGEDPPPAPPAFVPLAWPAYGECGPQTVENFDQKTAIMNDLRIDGAFGFDLNGDGKIDNKLGENALLKSTASQQVKASMEDGSVLLIMEYRGAADMTDSDCFDLNFYLGIDTDEDPSNNLGGAGVLDIDPRSLDENNQPVVRFPNAKIIDTPEKGPVVFAKTDEWVLSVPIDDNLTLNLAIGNASLQAEVDADGAISTGVLAGTISKGTLLTEIGAAIDIGNIDIAGIVGAPDQDTDGDGCDESYSIGIRFEAAKVDIRGVADQGIPGDPNPPEDVCVAASDAMACGEALDCSLECVKAAAGGMDWGCFGCCLRKTGDLDAVEKLRTLLNCPVEACSLDDAGNNVSEPADLAACLAGDFATGYEVCTTDTVEVVDPGPDPDPVGGEGEGEGEPGPDPAGEGEGEPDPIPAGEGEGEGEPAPAPAGEGEGEGEVAPVGGEGEGEGEGV